MIFYHTFDKKNYEVVRIGACSDASHFKKSGAQRVTDKSAIELRRVIEEIAEAIAKNAVDMSSHAGRKTVKAEDVKLASKQLNKY